VEHSWLLVQAHNLMRVGHIVGHIDVESRKCFTIKTTIFCHIANNFTNRAPLTMNSFTMMSVLTSNMCHSFYKLVLFTGSLLRTGWIKA